MSPRIGSLMLAGALLPHLLGCTPWRASPAKRGLLSLPRMSPDSVVFEVVLLDLTPEEAGDERLWREVDEQQLPPALRRELSRCGLRCGVLGTQLPDWVKRRLRDQHKRIELQSQDGAAVIGAVPTEQRLQCRAGRKRSISLGPVRDEVRVEPAAGTADQAKTWREAECGFALVATARGDGSVQVELTPEIQHGQPRHRWIGEDGAFRLDTSRDCEKSEHLRVAVTLTPGQTFVAASTPNGPGLGGAFFAADSPSSRRKVLLVRLAQTQTDDLFTPAPLATPTATPAQPVR